MPWTDERIPVSLFSAVHGTKPNEVVHADFLYMGHTEGSDVKYLLLVKDDLITNTRLWTCKNAESDAAAIAIPKWIA